MNTNTERQQQQSQAIEIDLDKMKVGSDLDRIFYRKSGSGFPPHKENEYIKACVVDLLAHAKTLTRGDMITHQDISQITGHPKDGRFWKQIVSKFKAAMQKEENGGIVLINIREVGYKLSEKQDHWGSNLQRRMRQSQRYAWFGAREVECIPDSELTDFEKRQKHAAKDRALFVRRTALQHMRVGELIMKPKETMPRVRPGAVHEETV